MIEISQLHKRFDQCRAIDGVTLSFPPGTVTAVLGLNGAGKTTLLRLIAGLEKPDRGSALVCGRQLAQQIDPTRLLGVHLGPGAQDVRHTVWRHLAWLAALGGFSPGRIEEVLAQVGLWECRADRISTLPLGARQRLAISGALLGDPDALVFDEPLNGLDVPGIVWFRSLLRGLAQQGKTVVIASHLLGEVVLTADRVVILERGRVTAAGSLAAIVPAADDPREHLENKLMAMATHTAGCGVHG